MNELGEPMDKQRASKEGGRYIIFYTFEDEESEEDESEED